MAGKGRANQAGRSLERAVFSLLLERGYQTGTPLPTPNEDKRAKSRRLKASKEARQELRRFIYLLRDEPHSAIEHPLWKEGVPYFATQTMLFESIFGNKVSCDFVLWHPQHFPFGAIVECKAQYRSGSVDEKIPYLYLNIIERSPCPTVIVYGGDGIRGAVVKWMRRKVDHHKLLGVFELEGFEAFLSR